MKNSFLQLAIEQKNLSLQTGATLRIRGMASTKNLDRYNEIIEPSAFLDSINLFMKNPVMLLQHNMSKPIGRFTSLNMTNDGLEVEGEVLHNDDGVIEKIKSGVLQAFSIGFIPKKWFIKNPDGKILATEKGKVSGVDYDELWLRWNTKTITELELVEISVVSIPANAHSLFGISESATKFFDNLQKDWQAEISVKNDEKTTENIPVIGDELRDTDNVANEVISQIENPADETISEENSENITSEDEIISSDEEGEKSLDVEGKNFEEISEKNIFLNQKIEELEAKNLELKGYAVSLVTMVEEKDAEIERLKLLLKNIPAKQGLVNLGENGKTREISPQNNKNFMESLMYRLGAELGE